MKNKRSQQSLDAEVRFCQNLTSIGATPMYDEWKGVNGRHKVICVNGHECFPTPSNLNYGYGICRTCAGQDPVVAERQFKENLRVMGAMPAYGSWGGSREPHRVFCSFGHECFPRPNNVQKGGGICRICANNDPVESERRFIDSLAKINAIPVYVRYEGAAKGHRVICAAGHECFPRPGDVRAGKGICKTCYGNDPKVAESNFRRNLSIIKAKPLYKKWCGVNEPHKVICMAGHICFPRPGNVHRGQGICLKCSGKIWDVFYVTINKIDGRIKFGITSGNPTPRLKEHSRNGYIKVERCLMNLPDSIARSIETLCKVTLKDTGHIPVQGIEYFSIAALPMVLDIVDNYPIPGR